MALKDAQIKGQRRDQTPTKLFDGGGLYVYLSPAGSQPRGSEAEPPDVYFVELDNGSVEQIPVDWLEPVENGTDPRRHCSVCGHGPESHVMRVCMRCGENEQSRIRFEWAPAHEFTLEEQT